MWKLDGDYCINDFLYKNGVINFSTLKSLGNQLNKENFAKVLQRFNISREDVVVPQQIHKNRIAYVTKKDAGKTIYNTDGLMTHAKNLGLVVFTADCVPLFLFNKKSRLIGLIHIGWKNLANGIIDTLYEEMVRNDVDTNGTLFFIGPHICGECYEFDQKLGKKYFKYGYKAKSQRLDLAKEITCLVKKYKGKVHISPFCTYHHNHLFFSYRKGEVDAKMVSLIMLSS